MSNEEKTAQEAAVEAMQAKADAANAASSGVGTRIRVGQTRGRNPQVISWEAFDESQPETLPKTLSDFMTLTGIDKMPGNSGENLIVSYLLDGFNSAAYIAASDPVAEFVDPTWSEDVQKQFRLVVRNYSIATGVSIEDAVALIKPGIVAAQRK